MTAIRIELPGSLLPWMRAGRGARSFTRPEQTEQQRRIQWAWAGAVASQHRGGQARWSKQGRYMVALVVTWPDAKRRDIDNASKTVCDALTGLAWDDDSQVDGLLVLRTTASRSEPTARLVISTMGTLVAAQAAAWWVELGALAFVGRVAGLLGERREAA